MALLAPLIVGGVEPMNRYPGIQSTYVPLAKGCLWFFESRGWGGGGGCWSYDKRKKKNFWKHKVLNLFGKLNERWGKNQSSKRHTKWYVRFTWYSTVLTSVLLWTSSALILNIGIYCDIILTSWIIKRTFGNPPGTCDYNTEEPYLTSNLALGDYDKTLGTLHCLCAVKFGRVGNSSRTMCHRPVFNNLFRI